MDEQLDNDLKNRIKEVFDNYQDTTADEGWLLLREKFPQEQPRRRGVFWLWWVAAAMLFLCLSIGLGIWINKEPAKNEAFSANRVKHATKAGQTVVKPTGGAINNSHNVAAAHAAESVQMAGLKNKTKLAKLGIAKADEKNNITHAVSTLSQANLVIAKKQTTPAVLQNTITGNNSPVDNIHTNNPLATVKSDASKTTGHQTSNRQFAATQKTDTPVLKPFIAKTKQPVKTIEAMLAADTLVKPINNNYRKVSLEVYAASYFNYAQGSSNQINVGAGFTVNIPLSEHLKLVSGISVGQNTLEYSNSVPIAATNDSYAVAVAATGSVSTYKAAQAIPSNTPAVATLKDYDANLVSLDVPLNLKYQFSAQGAGTYVLAGFSSGTFINEAYTSRYVYSNSTSAAITQTANKSFDNFYFAKTLNVAFGVGYPLGKNHMVIEPFLKYPLQGMGTQDIRFGSGGINLKFNFAPAKK